MQKLYIILLFSCLAFLSGCVKEAPLGGNSYIYGKLSYQNNLLENSEEQILKNRLVYLSAADGDSLNYYYHTLTDSLGYFMFNGLKKGDRYLIFFNDTIKGNRYTAYLTLNPNDHTNILKAAINSKAATGVRLRVTDEESNLLSGVSLYLYRSRVLAESKDPKGSIYQLSSNTNGEALQVNMAIGNWYVYANFQSDSLRLQDIQPFTIEEATLTSKTLVLKKE